MINDEITPQHTQHTQ